MKCPKCNCELELELKCVSENQSEINSQDDSTRKDELKSHKGLTYAKHPDTNAQIEKEINEVLIKVLSHNLCVVIQEISELGIKAEFKIEETRGWENEKQKIGTKS